MPAGRLGAPVAARPRSGEVAEGPDAADRSKSSFEERMKKRSKPGASSSS